MLSMHIIRLLVKHHKRKRNLSPGIIDVMYLLILCTTFLLPYSFGK